MYAFGDHKGVFQTRLMSVLSKKADERSQFESQ